MSDSTVPSARLLPHVLRVHAERLEFGATASRCLATAERAHDKREAAQLRHAADALDALREAVKPVRESVNVQNTCLTAGRVQDGRVIFYEISAPRMEALLASIAALLGEGGSNGR